jgi:hypothetical protein
MRKLAENLGPLRVNRVCNLAIHGEHLRVPRANVVARHLSRRVHGLAFENDKPYPTPSSFLVIGDVIVRGYSLARAQNGEVWLEYQPVSKFHASNTEGTEQVWEFRVCRWHFALPFYGVLNNPPDSAPRVPRIRHPFSGRVLEASRFALFSRTAPTRHLSLKLLPKKSTLLLLGVVYSYILAELSLLTVGIRSSMDWRLLHSMLCNRISGIKFAATGGTKPSWNKTKRTVGSPVRRPLYSNMYVGWSLEHWSSGERNKGNGQAGTSIWG